MTPAPAAAPPTALEVASTPSRGCFPRFHVWMAAILAAILICQAFLARALRIEGAEYLHSDPVLFAVAGVCCYSWPRFRRIRELGAVAIWAILISGALGLWA